MRNRLTIETGTLQALAGAAGHGPPDPLAEGAGDLGDLGDGMAYGSGINLHGHVVGYSASPAVTCTPSSTTERP